MKGKIFGPQEKEIWDAWNKFFLRSILQADQENTHKIIVVTIGTEHRYWLLKALWSAT
jgi:hypothetical protein